MEIAMPVTFGVLIESVIYYADQFGNKRNFDWRMIAALLAGVFAAVVFQVDAFGEHTAVVPYVGSVLTGVIFSRVANVTNDVVQRVRGKS